MEGQTLKSRYKILKKISSGGFGDTYQAEDGDLPGVTLCIVRHLRLTDLRAAVFPIAQKLFKREAETLYLLGQHPQIPKLMAYFEENYNFFLVEEFIDGEALTKEITKGTRHTEEYTTKLLKDILEVLSFVHQQGIVHRDLKPANLMRRKSDGKICLIDFGAVKELGSLAFNSATGETKATVAIGTPGYMPAEQMQGNPKFASDIYAVGIIAIQALTGIVPAEDIEKHPDTDELIWRGQTAGVSDHLATVIDKMVAYHRSNRYQDATEALQALKYSLPTRRQLEKEGNEKTLVVIPRIYQPPPSPQPPSPRQTQAPRRRFLELLLYGGGGALATFVVGTWLKSQNERSLEQNPGPISTEPKKTSTPNPTSTPTPSTKGNLLKTFNFETVTVNSSGVVIKREKRSAGFFTINLGGGVTMDLVAIPGGDFIMGSPETETGRGDDESPQRQVRIKPFFLGKYPVTQAQYQQVIGKNPSRFKGDDLPLENVTWNNALNFCYKISQLTGKNFTLPTEAQWEYACRGGTSTPFYFGETITSELANYKATETYASEPIGIDRGATTKVGSFPPNAFGLYDMHGNVWEWCLDDYHADYQNAPTDGSAWSNKSSGYKVFRGGSWLFVPKNCRSANRAWDPRDIFYSSGFRVCLSLLT